MSEIQFSSFISKLNKIHSELIQAKARIDNIKLRRSKATQGEWCVSIEGRDHTAGENVIFISRSDAPQVDFYIYGATVDDYDFIGNAFDDIDFLIKELAYVEKELEKILMKS